MSRTKYPYKYNSCKSAVVLMYNDAEMLFAAFRAVKYRIRIDMQSDNGHRERRYTVVACDFSRVIQYAQERCNALARKNKPKQLDVLIYKDSVARCNLKYYWGYTPTYRED